MATLTLLVLALVAHVTSADKCAGGLVRPVIWVPGFGGSPLYRGESAVFPSQDAQVNLALPLTWSDNLVQAQDDVVPGDDLSFGDGLFGSLAFSQLQELVQSWETPAPQPSGADFTKLFYTLGWDFRRDFWEQAVRVKDRVVEVVAETGCRPIIAAHSFGGRLVHAAFARYGEALGEQVLAVAYGGVPFQPSTAYTSTLSGPFLFTTTDQFDGTDAATAYTAVPQSTVFSFATSFALSPRPADTCAAPVDDPDAAAGCAPTGLVCAAGSAACAGARGCGPGAAPDAFADLDFTSPDVWLGLYGAFPAYQGLVAPPPPGAPGGPADHLAGALAASVRLAEFLFEEDKAREVAAAHPPAAVLTQAVPTLPPFALTTPYLEITGECELIAAGAAPSDGFVLKYMQRLPLPELWADKTTVYEFTEAPAIYTSDPRAAFVTPHAVVFQRAATPLPAGMPLDCAAYGAGAPGPGASLEDILCRLVKIGGPSTTGNGNSANGNSGGNGACKRVCTMRTRPATASTSSSSSSTSSSSGSASASASVTASGGTGSRRLAAATRMSQSTSFSSTTSSSSSTSSFSATTSTSTGGGRSGASFSETCSCSDGQCVCTKCECPCATCDDE